MVQSEPRNLDSRACNLKPDSQRKDLFLVSRLNGIAFGLTSITGDDGKVFACNGQDGSSVG